MWLVRRWLRMWAWVGRWPWWLKVFTAATVFTSPGWVWFAVSFLLIQREYWFTYTDEDREFVRAQGKVHPEGLPSAARRLKAEMESAPDPDAARQSHPEWVVVRLTRGEWVFGYGLDSHRQVRAGRGTLVTKDSRGRVRCFFGHVCGDHGTELAFRQFEHVQTLDEFYSELQRGDRFREWVPGP